ncbi:TonB-dependent receptor [Limibacter armeniacum]|uniref:SusC/RagA family TonB-linked outer membrane protein n=1 Tax=Limibacter armeniacum TaxID=466084 RepID=UPI002FE5EE50
MKHIITKSTLMKYTFIICLAGLFSVVAPSLLYAQASITGTVNDTDTGEPLIGVNVLVKGTSTGTITDMDGRYKLLDVPEGGTLVFSYIGYKKKELMVGNQKVINVKLEADLEQLTEVVVVGYGVQEKKDITGAVGLVDGEAMDDRVKANMGSLLQGQAAGVQVVSTSGKPSAGLSVRIRGTNSLSASSEPLYVVDGVPVSDTRSINPSDIESISILKDASSAAIYGTQGANGVVLITTKRGQTGKPQFKFNAYTGFSSPWKKLKVLNAEQYRDLMEEMGKSTDWSKYQANTDWQDEVFQNGTSQNYQLSVAGKSEGTTYYISGGYTQQVGSIRSSEMERLNFKLNLDQEINNWIKVGTSLSYTDYSDVDVSDNQAVNQGGVILGMLTTPPNIGIYNENGSFTSNPFQNWENPISATDGSDRGYKNRNLIGNVYAELSLLQDLKFKSNMGVDLSSSMYDYFLDPYTTSYGRAMKGISRNNTNFNTYSIFDNTLTYSKSIGDHKVTALVGSIYQKYRWENNSIERRNFSSDNITTPGAGSEIITATAGKSEKSNASFIGRLNYDYNDKYLMTVNFRADGSSAFGPGKRWGYFPSLSVGWRLSEENFLKNNDLVSDLKLRAGWGIVGKDIDPYAYLGKIGGGANYPIGGQAMPGNYPSSIENRNLKWEETEQTNIGVDLAIFEGRVNITADAYYKKTSDLLLNAPIPTSTGFSSAIQNVGGLTNKGLEFQVSSINMDNEIRWETSFNISFNRNVVDYTQGGEFFKAEVPSRGYVTLTREGLPIDVFYGYVAGGVDPETGMVYYINKDGESTFTPDADDRQIIGNPNPDFIYSMTNNLSYKGISLSIMLQGSQGNDIFNATRIETEGMTDAKNQTHGVVNRWRQPGDVTDVPKAVWGSTDNSRISTRFVEDGSYLRVKAITLGYDLPATVASQLHLSGLRFYATGENLFTWTNYSGYDPEVNGIASGVDFGTYPQSRNLILGVNVSF